MKCTILIIAVISFTLMVSGETISADIVENNILTVEENGDYAASITTPLKISIMQENPPLSMLMPDGQPTGLYVEFWQLWSKVNHVPVSFEPSSFINNLKALKERKVDFHAGLFVNDERLTWADFSVPIHRVTSGVFFSNQKPLQLKELGNRKIGVQKGSHQSYQLAANFPNLNILEYEDAVVMITALLEHDIEALVSEIPYLNAELGRMGLRGTLTLSEESFSTNSVHALIPKGNPKFVEMINDGIRNIPVSMLTDLEKKWLPQGPFYYQNRSLVSVSSLSAMEQDWLIPHSNFILGVAPSLPPFEEINSEGKYIGISSDFASIVADKLSIKMLPLTGLTWPEVMKKAESGQIDILPAVVKTKKREVFLSFTKPYYSFPLVIATNSNHYSIESLDDLDYRKVGVGKSTPAEELLRLNHPKLKIITIENVNEGLTRLNNGELDAVVHNFGVISYAINRSNYSNIKVVAQTPYTLDISMGVRKGLEPLIPILNKTLSTIDSKKRTSIINSWLTVKANLGIDYTTILWWSLPIVSVFLIIIWLVTRANQRMQFEITERSRVEQSLELAMEQANIAKEQAVSANKAKDTFLANMSHEIRTPMNAVMGMSHLLGLSKLDQEQKNYVKVLDNSASNLLLLIDGILDLSKIEAGKLDLEIVPFTMHSILDNIIVQTELSLNKEIKLSQNISEQVPATLLGDPLRIGQILLNLVSNAVKFTEQGEINISIDLSDKTPDSVILQFSVSDTGIGMTAEQMERLFTVYSQADSSTTRKYGGTGLGLSICRKLCEKMNGQIWVDSEVGVGSIFHCTVSFGYSELEIGNEKSSQNKDSKLLSENLSDGQSNKQKYFPSLAKKKVLVVDDNHINLSIASKILTKAGILIETANNGKVAIEKLQENNFDAVLMDIQMPEMDGYTATRQIRKIKRYQDLPIIALSANMMSQDVNKSLEIGMNAHIGKPINVQHLLATLAKLIG